MITIGRMPQKVQRFFAPAHRYFGKKAWVHFWQLVLALSISHGSTLDRLSKLLRNSTHRTKHGEFLWQSHWEAPQVIQQIALDILKRLRHKKASQLFFIIDETQTLKRAKKMAGVGKLFHHASGKYGTGHTMLKICLWYRGVTIPWGTWLYLKKEDAQTEKLPFRKLTQLAAEAIRQAPLPAGLNITVLFDCYYLCPTVVEACRSRGWHYIGVGKLNRRFFIHGQSRRLGRYGRNVLRREGRWHSIAGLAKTRWYQLAGRIGNLNKLGIVKVVFSRRRGERNLVALVTDDLHASMKRIVADYLKRWAIELMIKDQKQHLGLGDYRVRRYEAVVRHLLLVDAAYACLTHVGWKAHRAQGHQQKKENVLRLPPISQLKTRMRQMIWQETIQEVIKNSHEKLVIRRLEQLLAA
jgi:SRSO17 transposase